jgi:hypothetical protein
MIADCRLPIVDCPRNETRKSKFETRERMVGFRVWILQFRFSNFGLRESIVNRQSAIDNRQLARSACCRSHWLFADS